MTLVRTLALVLVWAWFTTASAQTIVIDAGHGGTDGGAVGVAEIDEKELTLRTSLALRDALQEALPNARIIMTREGDEYPTLDERAALANREAADLLVSVHYNAAVNPLAEGIETFWLDPSGTAPGEIVPGREEDGACAVRSHHGASGDVARVVREDLLRDGAMRRSATAAERVHAALIHRTRATDRGVRQAQFRVLRGIRVPAIVVELGFLTNAREGRRVLDESYHDRLVEGLVQGVVAFLQSADDEALAYGYGAPSGAQVAVQPAAAEPSPRAETLRTASHP